MKTILFIDTETTGLPEKDPLNNSAFYPPEMYDKYDKARMIELACALYELNEHTGSMFHIKSVSSIIVPNGFTIENESVHGITTEQAMKYGKPLPDILKILYYDFLNQANEVIGHNVSFDMNILLSECYRMSHDSRNNAPFQGTRNRVRSLNIKYEELIEKLQIIPTKCTMKMGRKVLNLSKYPKLTELYSMFNKNQCTHQNHRAMEDIQWTSVCYMGIRNMIQRYKDRIPFNII